jgi:hypothetical protein
VKTTILLTTVFLGLGGCVTTMPGHLYPVQGPLSKETAPPIYTATMLGGPALSGPITVHMAAGITCSGDAKALSPDDPTARRMSVEWDVVYGSGYFVANVLGQPGFARSALACTNGENLSVEFVKSVNPPNVGVVSDGTGNIFKLSF